MHRGYTIINFQEEKGSAVVVIIVHVYFTYCLLVTLMISSCHHSYYLRILINSQRACARAFRIWRVHIQIIAVGVTNRRDQQKMRFIAFADPFGQP